MNADRTQTNGSPQAAQWWSIVQAVAWMVERSERAVERAMKVPLLRSLKRMTPRLVPTSTGDSPPISLDAAPGELLRAVREDRVTIRGQLRGVAELNTVPVQLGDKLQDHKGAPCIGGTDVYRGGRFWSGLFIRSEDCMRLWPAPVRTPTVNGTGLAAAPLMPSPEPPVNSWVGRDAPPEFHSWVKEQREAAVIITQPAALEAMRGKLSPQPGRDTVRIWVKALAANQRAARGTSPPKSGLPTERGPNRR
jgi:hypothetical protein